MKMQVLAVAKWQDSPNLVDPLLVHALMSSDLQIFVVLAVERQRSLKWFYYTATNIKLTVAYI